MNKRKDILRLINGIFAWVALIGLVAIVWANNPIDDYQPAQQLGDYVYDRYFEVQLHYDWLPDWPRPKAGDVVRYRQVLNENRQPGEDELIQVLPIGEVFAVKELPGGGADLTVHIFPHARDRVASDTVFLAYTGPENFEEVLEMLIDDNARTGMEGQWQNFLNAHQMQIEEIFKPLIESTLADFMAVVTPDLETAINDHSEDFNAIFRTYWDGSVKERLMPMIEQKGMPQVEAQIVPIVRECGQELWDNAPAGSFAWNAFRDKIVPWDSKTNLQQRFDLWLREEGRPIIDKYVPRMKAEAEKIGINLANDPDIGAVTRGMLADVIGDPRLGSLLQKVIQSAIVDNPKTTQFLRERWSDGRVQGALRRVGRLIEPYANAAIDSILLDRNARRINPNLVTVMRSQILWKGDFWILAGPGRTSGTTTDAADARRVPDGHRFTAPNTKVGYSTRQ
ncbi:MAG: hypothetical protein AB7K09_13885 [Planctomycetota bacterium]